MDNSDSNTPTQEKVKRKRNRISKYPKQVALDIDAARLVLLDETAVALKKSRNALIRDFVDAGLGKYYKLAFMR